jgi:uncharacterized protein (TIGR02145 family)
LSGKTCFDIAESNDNADCGTLTARATNKADFTQAATHTQTYTFTKSTTGTVQNVRYIIQDAEGVLLATQSLGGTLESGTMTNATATLQLQFKTNLNSPAATPQIYGRARAAAAKVTINIIYNNGSIDVKVPLTLSIQDCSCCGAKIDANVWKEFMCHNLGADQSLDPFNPVAGLNGDYYQWGYKYPSVTFNTINGTPTCPTCSTYSAWKSSVGTAAYYGDNTTNDNTVKSPSDPCPSGYRVPSLSEWQGVWDNNPRTNKGSWGTASATNYSGAMFGPALFLPAAGYRSSTVGSLNHRGSNGYYWSTRKSSDTNAGSAYFDSGGTYTLYNSRAYGRSVRCITE